MPNNVSFNEEPTYSRPAAVSRQSVFTRMVMKTGIAKTERGAQMVLLGVAVVAFVIAAYLIFGSVTTSTVTPPPPLTPPTP